MVLVLIPFALLWPYRQAGFVADDLFFGRLYVAPSWPDVLTQPWPHGIGATVAWRPLVIASWVFSAHWLPMVGPEEGHRLFNLLLHGLNAWLLCLLTRRVTGSPRAAFWTGALFAIHPIAHESVMWISGRTFLIAAFLGQVLVLWTFDRHRRARWVQQTVGGG